MRVDPHADEVAKLAAKLEREHPIRLQMLGVVTLAALAGFLVSFALLHLGLTHMAIRYAIATAAGYAVFVVSVRMWLFGRDATSRLRDDGSRSTGWNFGGFGRLGGKSASSTGESLFQGGRSGGAGASASFDAPQTQMFAMASSQQPQGSSNGWSGLGKLGGKSSGGSGGGSGKGLLPLVVLALIVIGIAVVGRVVWQSPNLIADMLVDGAVAGSALRGMQRAHRNREIDVVQHTWIPALIVLVLMVTIGWAAQRVEPQAISIGDVFR